MRDQTGLKTIGGGLRRLVESCGPIETGNEAGRLRGPDRIGKIAEGAEIRENGIGFGFDKTLNLFCGIERSGNRPQHERVIEGHYERSSIGLKDAPQANRLAKISQAISPVKRYNTRKSRPRVVSCQLRTGQHHARDKQVPPPSLRSGSE